MYNQLMMGSYLEIMTNILQDEFSFTNEMIEQLNERIDEKTKPQEELETETVEAE